MQGTDNETAAETRRPKVLQVTARFLPEMGGIEAHVRELSTMLVELGWDVDVLTSDRTGQLPSEERIGGVLVRRLPAWPRKRDWLLAPGIAGAIRSTDADIIHVQGITDFTPPMAMLACLMGSKPYVVTFHTGGHPSAFRTRLRGLQWKALSPLVRRASHRIAVSRFEAAIFHRAMGRKDAAISVIRNGGHAYHAPPSSPTVAELGGVVISGAAVRLLSVGRLERYKGHDRAIEATAALLRRGLDAHLTILGVGPDAQRLRRLAAEQSIETRVTITSIPARDRLSMANEMARASVVLLLSDYEGHPVSIMEARSVGAPVIVLLGSGLTELVDDGHCIGVSPNAGPEETADTILRVVSSPHPVLSTSEVPTWEACAEEVAVTYMSALRMNRPGRRRTHGWQLGARLP